MEPLPRKIYWLGITLFSILGPLCIYRAIQKSGEQWFTASIQTIFNDPIYLYAVADLAAIFLIISYWVFLECRRNNRVFWPWGISFLLFKLSGKRSNKQ
jgi:hypothetical protein